MGNRQRSVRVGFNYPVIIRNPSRTVTDCAARGVPDRGNVLTAVLRVLPAVLRVLPAALPAVARWHAVLPKDYNRNVLASGDI